MTLKASNRSAIPPFRTLDIFGEVSRLRAEAKPGDPEIIQMAAGQPAGGAPRSALEYGAKVMLDDPQQAYTAALGMPALRERISGWYGERYGVNVPASRIAVTEGGSGALHYAFATAFDAGDRIAMGVPGYAAYRNVMQTLDLETVDLMTDESTRFQPTVAQLESLDQPIDGLIITSPSNPTGTMLSAGELKDIAQWCKNHGVRLISDEIYHGVVFDEPAETVLRYTDEAIVVNSFSKFFGMPGFRVGWMVMPEDLIERVKDVASNAVVAPVTISQHVALKAFDSIPELDSRSNLYLTNRNRLLPALEEAGIHVPCPPEGAFYVWADVSKLTDDSLIFCKELLDGTGVAVSPGVDFDPHRGQRFIRISFVESPERVSEACDRIVAWSAARQAAPKP